MTNVLGKDYMQLICLKIGTVIYFSPNKFEDLEKNFTCIHYKVEKFNKDTVCELPDFKDVTEQISHANANGNGPVFMFCVNGFLSAAIAARYVVENTKGANKQLAIASVMSKRYDNKDIPSWLF